MAPPLRNCCCCISLKSGATILASLTLVGALIYVGTLSVALFLSINNGDVLEEMIREAVISTPSLSEKDTTTIVLGIRIWLGFYVGVAVLVAIYSIMMLYGALNVS